MLARLLRLLLLILFAECLVWTGIRIVALLFARKACHVDVLKLRCWIHRENQVQVRLRDLLLLTISRLVSLRATPVTNHVLLWLPAKATTHHSKLITPTTILTSSSAIISITVVVVVCSMDLVVDPVL